jgi:hypothetical protein
MTIQVMHDIFKFEMDKLDSLNYPNFLEEEIDLLLNQAQERFVKQRYGTTNAKKESYEETQKRIEDLKNITINAILTPLANASDNIDPNASFVNLPSDHWFIVQERVKVSYPDCRGNYIDKYLEVRPIQHNEFSKIISDPFKKPNISKVLRLMENGRVELIYAPEVVISDYRLRYIKKPVEVSLANNIDCELSEHTHSEIVAEAVRIALEGIEAKRNQTYVPIIQNTEE